jgi:Fe2+ transport system protein FeoA/Mn-dependent DtxR family transcriptional regulator
MSSVSSWFWPVLSFLLAALWLWTLLRYRRATSAARMSAPGLMQRSVEAEDALKAAYFLQEAGGEPWDGEKLAHAAGLPGVLAGEAAKALIAFGWAEVDAQGGMRLTEIGKARARELIRAHRLWERYLVDREGMPLEEVHAEAHRREHETTPEELERMDVELGEPAWDPHGDPIPAPGYRVPFPSGSPLLEKGIPGSRLRIVHLDDEPAPLLAQLVTMGLKPGVDVEVVDREPDLLRLQTDGDVIPLAVAAARHVSVVPAPVVPVPLDEVGVGSRTRVVEVKGSGKHQRRMLDMGLVPGAEVIVVREAPLGDPVEYRVKGTAISMRRADANTVLVEEVTHG